VLRAALIALTLLACGRPEKRELDFDQIQPLGAHLRTDTVGGGEFTDKATFVLVDAKNHATEGAYVTLGGELLDASKNPVGQLSPMSLWIPPGEIRTFALVDSERKERTTAVGARAKVRGASVFPPPLAHLEEIHRFDDHGQLVIQAYLVNDSERDGTIMVVAAFHDKEVDGKPLTRPFSVVKIKAKQDPATPGNCPEDGTNRLPQHSKCPISFVGPPGAKRATIFVADTVY
jgi:hypothetical protein